MDKQKLDYFRNLLLEQRRQALEDVREDRADALGDPGGVIDSEEAAQLELSKSTALEVASRQSDFVADIDTALQRIDDGTYGQCERCGKPIDEQRLKALPTARYDAECQSAVEVKQQIATPTL